ncbi:hypothetical protein DRH29_03880 [candidate division Kazan bacterium]|uniref:Ribbon-helix-helix protein CopG domain-containing protein n=1 Tax=candidate division Kazan bacterium TaxID=2202143 RepID=A0A420ZC37_UNCK3|nr:MAG: hypothetical protein DRH29_03880 [candidate division Kazan bacterium]
MLRIVTFKLKEEELEILDLLSRNLKKTRSDVIRLALRKLFKEFNIKVEIKNESDFSYRKYDRFLRNMRREYDSVQMQ